MTASKLPATNITGDFRTLIIGHFGEESFQAIDYTGTDNQKQSNATLHTPEKRKRKIKTALANITIYALIWYVFYDLRRPEDGVGTILRAPAPTRATRECGVVMRSVASVCSVWALTCESLDVEASFLICRYVFRISYSSSYIKVIGSRSRSTEQKTIHKRN